MGIAPYENGFFPLFSVRAHGHYFRFIKGTGTLVEACHSHCFRCLRIPYSMDLHCIPEKSDFGNAFYCLPCLLAFDLYHQWCNALYNLPENADQGK